MHPHPNKAIQPAPSIKCHPPTHPSSTGKLQTKLQMHVMTNLPSLLHAVSRFAYSERTDTNKTEQNKTNITRTVKIETSVGILLTRTITCIEFPAGALPSMLAYFLVLLFVSLDGEFFQTSQSRNIRIKTLLERKTNRGTIK